MILLVAYVMWFWWWVDEWLWRVCGMILRGEKQSDCSDACPSDTFWPQTLQTL